MRRVLLMLALVGTLHAQEAGKVSASLTARDPASLVAGQTSTLQLRGFKLGDPSGIRFPKAPTVKAEIKESRKAEAVKGIGEDVSGDTQLRVEFILPDDFPAGPLEFILSTPAGEATGMVPVLEPSAVIDEIEPNNGFRQSQKLEPGKSVRGSIGSEKDVDVYELSASAGRKFRVTVTGGSAVTMDLVLTCYDAGGQFLASNDDADSARNPALSLTAPADGPVRLCLSDAHQLGGAWHSYLLSVEEEK